MKIAMTQVNANRYEGVNGCVLAREYGQTPNGNNLNGRWVLRDSQGVMIDFDQYSNDLAERYNLHLH